MTQEHVDPKVELNQILARLSFPKSRGEVLDAVRSASSGDAVVDLLSNLPEGTYGRASEIMAHVEV